MSTNTPTVVITDWTFPDLSVEESILKPAQVQLVARPCRTESELIAVCGAADAVITQFARLNGTVIQAMTRTRVIVRYGVGVDNVDLEAARERGIPVCNIPDYCIDEVADHTLAFMLAITRQVVPNTLHLRAGHWGLATPLPSMQALRDLTVGVVGFGRIGREVVQRLLAFKTRVLVFDPAVSPAEITRIGAIPTPTFDELLPQCDIVTPHCPSGPKTRGLFNADSIARMKPGAILINVGRGDLVNSPALVAALQSGHLGGAALDVFDPEPIPAEHPIRQMPNVILAAHIASASVPAARKLRETAALLALKAVRREPLPNVVNGVSAKP
jgi:D-3-phosphoglycerate dehydrogenase